MTCPSVPKHLRHLDMQTVKMRVYVPQHSAVPAGAGTRLAFLKRKPASTGRRLGIVRFRENTANTDFSLPVDYYQLLQLQPGARTTTESVRKAFDQVLKLSPATNYSHDTLFSRAVLLKAAAEVLGDYDLRRSYDAKVQALGSPDMRVSQHELPGALVLLQERGEYQTVIEYGSRWLERNAGNPFVSDMAACLALAYCDRAGVSLQNSSNGVLSACDDLQTALKLLTNNKMSEQLQVQIDEALQDLAPDHALELLALPVTPENAGQRAKGVTLLRGALRRCSQEQSPELNEQVMRAIGKAKDTMTAAEQIMVLPGAQACGVPPAELAYDLALAYIAEGYTTGKPHYITRAAQLLKGAEQGHALQRAASAVGAGRKGEEEEEEEGAAQGTAIERAVCAVLLNDRAAALELLNLAPSSRDEPEPQMEQFVREHSNGESDLTPGLRAMALRWVEGVALQAFVDTREQTRRPTPGPALAQWFATGSVAVYLAVRAVTRADAVLAFVHNTLEFMSKMMARIAAIFASVAASKQHATKAAATVTATGSKGANSQRSSGRAGLSGRSASGPSPAASAGSGVSRLAGAAAAGAAGVAQAASASASQTMQQTGPLGHPAGSTLQRGGDADSDVHASPAEALAAGRQVSSSELDAFAAANTAARAANRRLSSYDDEDGEMGALAGAQEGRGARGMMMRGGEEHEEGAKGPATARARRMAAAVDYDEQLDGEEEVEPIIGTVSARSEEELRRQLQSLEAAMWDSDAAPGGTTSGAGSLKAALAMWAKPALALAVAVAAVAAVVITKPLQARLPSITTPAPAAAAAAVVGTSTAAAVAAADVSLNKRDAESLLRTWFAIKGQALGPAYQASVLSSVLGGEQLSRWASVVKTLKQEGVHWRVQLLSVKVTGVRALGGGEWEISAAVHEDGKLLDGQGALHDAYNTRYNVKYTAAATGPAGAWLIVSGQDL